MLNAKILLATVGLWLATAAVANGQFTAVPVTVQPPDNSSSPICVTDQPCNFTDEIRRNQMGCEPCRCRTADMCQPCIRPLTTRCQCMCVDPTEPRPERDDTAEPPDITPEQVHSAFEEIHGNLTDMVAEFSGNRTLVKNCFSKKASKALKKLETALNKAGTAAQSVMTSLEGRQNLSDTDVINEIDKTAAALDAARKQFEKFCDSALSAIVAETGMTVNDTSDASQTSRAIEAWQPSTDCDVAKRLIIWWHPYYWYWYYPFYWSFYHRIWYFWFCAWYIRIVIRLRVWWWWIWRPWGWPWFWPWGWCNYWWPWGWWWGWWYRWWWWG